MQNYLSTWTANCTLLYLAEFYRGFKVDTVLVDGFHRPYYAEFTEPELSYIWLHPLKGKEVRPKFDQPFVPIKATQPINGVQATLF